MDNPTYLGDSVYAFHNGANIELRLDRHDSITMIYLERETIQALNRFADSFTQDATMRLPSVPQTEAMTAALAAKRSELERNLEFFDRCASILSKLPDHIVNNAQPVGNQLVIYWCEREDVKDILSLLGAGKWTKQVNDGKPDKIDYTTEIDGIIVQMWAAAPPESCKIVEEEVEVPAHKTIKRTLVCH